MNSPMGDFLAPPGFSGPRGWRALAREGSLVTEAAQFVWRRHGWRPESVRVRPSGEPVLLVPGFLAGDYTLAGMAALLDEAGFLPHRSGIAVANIGCTRRTADQLEGRLEQLADRYQQRISIVGHSLGGMLARALAARRPDLVAGIVSMGSPILAPAAVHEILAWNVSLLARLSQLGLPGMMAAECVAGACARESFEESHLPLDPSVGFTAIYSRRDGVADWKACVDPAARPVEVRTSHIGMAFDPVVFDAVRTALEGQRRVAQRALAQAAGWS